MSSSSDLAPGRRITAHGLFMVVLALFGTPWGLPTAAATAGGVATAQQIHSELTAATGGWSWPLDPRPRVVRGFEPPADPWGPGHRGIDLAGAPGQPVLAVAPGTVAYAGEVADVGVVVVRHGGVRSTYQPVLPAVRVGDRVETGAMLGSLASPASHCLPATCLHLGARHADTYLDPLSLLRDLPIRLKPLEGLPGEPSASAEFPAPWTAGVPAWWSLALDRGLGAPSSAWVGLTIGRA